MDDARRRTKPIAIDHPSESEKETLQVANDLKFGGQMKVIKTGRTTGTTVGVLQHNILSVKVHKSFFVQGIFCIF